MNIDLFPLILFVTATTFSPGPNNIASASMGIQYGYRKTRGFLLGISAGFFMVMICCAVLSGWMLQLLPAAEQYLRWLGTLYILWLAVNTLLSGNAAAGEKGDRRAFAKGFVLQLFNPKVAVYGMTLFSTFLAPASGRRLVLVCFAAGFAAVAFTATSVWALCGAAIKNRLADDWFAKRVRLVLALLLIYTAVDLSGVLTRF